MARQRKTEELDSIYAATSSEEVARKYDAWAKSYDGEMASLGYRHPTICLALLCRYLPREAAPILDAGAGTGLIGEWLKIVGFSDAEALDLSEGMLEVARSKGVYRRLHRAAMGQALPLESDSFAGAVCAGVFTVGHVGVEGLEELARVVRPNGIIVLTVKDRLWESGFAEQIAVQERQGAWQLLEETPSYVSMPGRPDTVPSRALVLRIK